MTDTFTWRADIDLSGNTEFNVSRAQFGDGYRQQFPLGINNKRKKFSVTVSGYYALIKDVKDFIDAQNGMPFFYRPPFGTAAELYTCQRYNEPQDMGGMYYKFTMEFEQDFGP